ncbi:MAG: hypothetical protein R3F56_25725 [Planctomycetota bacterium]
MKMRIPLLIAAALGSTSCAFLRDLATRPPAETPVAEQHGYLAKDKEAVDDELGPDERLLLAEFSDTRAAKLALETKLAEAQATIDSLKSNLRATEEARDRERTAHAAAEAELTRLRTTLQDRETKILTLHLEKAKLTQDVLSLKIEAAEHHTDVAGEAARTLDAHAGPLGGQR